MQGVFFGDPNLVRLAQELFDAGVYAVVAVDVDHEVLEERRTGQNLASCACVSVGHTIDRSGQRAGLYPVSGFGAYDQNIHAYVLSK